MITLWILGLCVMLLALGGLSLDLWRSFSARRALAADADAAALAGAAAVDIDRYLTSGDVELVPAAAEERARSILAREPDRGALRSADVRATTDGVTVVVHGHVGSTLLALVHRGGFDVAFTATAVPRRSS
jgi:hypothetical protein